MDSWAIVPQERKDTAQLESEHEPASADAKVDILVVDDNRSNMLALEAMLSDLGQNLVTASSGTEAL